MRVHIRLNERSTRFVAEGGDPKGGDKVNTVISTWPGWARMHAQAGRSLYAGPLSTTSALALSQTTLELDWETSARERVGVLLEAFRRARSTLEGPTADLRMQGLPTARKPMGYQVAGVKAMQFLAGRCWLSDDMGLGKTAQALWLAHELNASRLLVLCPASVKFNWQKEVAATLGDQWPCQVIDGNARKRTDQFADLDAMWKAHQRLAIVINYDLLAYISDSQLERLRRFAVEQMVVMDEAHYLKNPTAERTRVVVDNFCPAEGGARWRLCVTGTPIRNTVEDVYQQVELVRPGTFHSLHWFLNRFTVQSVIRVGKRKQVRKKKVRRAKNTSELNVILNTLQVQRKKEQVTDLPPKVHTYPDLELDPHTAKVYAAMRDYALYQLEEHDEQLSVLSPTCRTAVEAAARCEQLAQGCVGGVPDEVVRRVSGTLSKHAEAVRGKDGWLVFPKSTKLAWLAEQLETVKKQGGQSVVFSRFNAPLLWLEQQHEDYEHGVCVTGNMPAATRQEVFDDFQAGDVQELYIQIKIAEGFNLQRAKDEFFLGREWAPASNWQAEDRCHRIGQTGTVNIQIPVVRGTIEVRQHRALESKGRDAADVLCFQTIKDLKEALSA